MTAVRNALIALVAVSAPAAAQRAPSAPITNISYDVTFNRETAARRTIEVSMAFTAAGPGDILLSLPSWTPGAYEVTNFARWISRLSVKSGDKELRWDKLDYDTWRVRPAGSKAITVSFTYTADSLDNAMAWSKENFAFFNGTNLFMYADGRPLGFPATVRVHTEAEWKIATGMASAGKAGSYSERNFHDLVDMPFFVGEFDYDSADVSGINVRLATYPSGSLAGEPRKQFWEGYEKLFAPQEAVFGETPFNNYTTMMVFDEQFGGGSALEHQRSHVGIYTPSAIGQPWFMGITAHEMFHAWNVKRLRPAEMVPYRYDIAQPTPWLWVSEGITDYYADLTLARAGLIDSAGFFGLINDKVTTVGEALPVALEDASIDTWIHPTDGTGYLYYPKGSLAGLMLDIMIRNSTSNRRSLDDVMRQAYRTTYKAGRGFNATDWWGAVRTAAGRTFPDFNERFIDGRDPFPWDSILPLAGLKLTADSIHVPRLGVETQTDSTGVKIVNLMPGGPAATAGVQVGDMILSIGDIPVTDQRAFDTFRERYADKGGSEISLRVRRGKETLGFKMKVMLAVLTAPAIVADGDASPLAASIRHGILTGTTTK